MYRIILQNSVRLGIALLLLMLGATTVRADDPPGSGLPILGGFEKQIDESAAFGAPTITLTEPVLGQGAPAMGPFENAIKTQEPQFGGTRKFKAKTKRFIAPNEPKKPPSENSSKNAASFVTAFAAWTTDSGGIVRSTYTKGQIIRYGGQINNTTGATQSAFVQWFRNSPCGGTTLWQGWLTVPAGTPWWFIDDLAGCPGTQTYTFSVTFNNTTTSRAVTYRVKKPGKVAAQNAWTMDSGGNARSTFVNGQVMRYGGQVKNTTGSTRSAYLQWIRNSPCGGTTLWQGWMDVPPGSPWWYMEALAFCPGTHSFTFSVTFNNKTTTRSVSYTVTAGNVTAFYAWTMDSWGVSRNVFYNGQVMRYGGQVSNPTGSTQRAYLQWLRNSPCGPTTLWQGWLDVPNGTPWWYMEALAFCPGTHTYTFIVTQNNVTTSRSYSYQVY